MNLESYIPLLIQVVLAVGMGLAIIIASHIFGQRAKKNALKDSAYECGVKPFDKAHQRISVKFYVVALLFVIFDIEIIFMIPFALIYSDFVSANLPIILPILFFIAMIFTGIIYEVRKNALDWNIPKTNI